MHKTISWMCQRRQRWLKRMREIFSKFFLKPKDWYILNFRFFFVFEFLGRSNLFFGDFLQVFRRVGVGTRCVGGKHASSSASPATLMSAGCIAAATTPAGGWVLLPPRSGEPHPSPPLPPRNHQIMILCVYYKTPRIHIRAEALVEFDRGIQFTNYSLRPCVQCSGRLE